MSAKGFEEDTELNMTVPEPLELDEQYQKQDKPWGKCFPFLFKNGRPKIVIGPHWPLFIFAYFAFLVISVVLLIWQYKRETSNIILMTSLFIDLNHSLSYLWVALVNPGVANKQNAETLPTTIDETNRYQNEKRRNQQWYCKTCKLIQLSHTHHCYDCDVCVLEMDHHCPWTGKCIGKGNIKQFYYFLASTLIFMVYNIIISITQIDDVRRK